MKKYRFSRQVTEEITIEAEDQEEALRQAETAWDTDWYKTSSWEEIILEDEEDLD